MNLTMLISPAKIPLTAVSKIEIYRMKQEIGQQIKPEKYR
jgi:hypothetical protein